MTTIAQLFAGFSVFYALVLIISQLFCSEYQNKKVAGFMGGFLFLSLIGLQTSHFFYLQNINDFIKSSTYVAILFVVAPSFYFYSKPLLKDDERFKWFYILHYSPVIIAFIVPYKAAFLLAFVIGSLYLLWLAKAIYALKKHRKNFQSEIVALSVVFVIAIIVAIFGLLMPYFNDKLFFSLYTSAIGLAFFLVAIVVTYKPQLSESVSEAAKETYSVSTLTQIDCAKKLSDLENLMSHDLLFQENNLDLQTVASQLDLSTHQLSELINTSLGKSFSRYLREQRICFAQKALVEQPKASVLSLGIEAGFSSQSNFYEAFKEITGTTPAKFRKLNL
jgi:AraC-like DNA-binding protein